MKKLAKGLAAALGILLLAGAGIYWKYFTTSADIARYSRYYLHAGNEPQLGGAVRATFLGTATLLFDDGETQLMTDGFFSRVPLRALLRPIRTDTAVVDAALARAHVDRLKALFVAHSHYDHALDVAYVVQKTHAHLYGSVSTLNIGRGGGLTEDQMSLYAIGQPLTLGKFTVTVLASRHSPATAVNNDLGQVVGKPLPQPAMASAYKEGGAFDFLIRHGGHAILVKASGNYIEGAWDGLHADVVFLGAGALGKRSAEFQDAYYDQTVGKVHPRLVIPVHWDSFLLPLTERLEAPMDLVDDLPRGFDFLIRRLEADKIQFGILQGFESTVLFDEGRG